jgi:hypothetical protein
VAENGSGANSVVNCAERKDHAAVDPSETAVHSVTKNWADASSVANAAENDGWADSVEAKSNTGANSG